MRSARLPRERTDHGQLCADRGSKSATIRHEWDNFSLCGLGRANEGVLGKAVLKDKNGVVLAQVAPMFVPGSGFLFTLFDFPVPVGTPATTEGTLTVEADNPSGLPHNDFRVTVPLDVRPYATRRAQLRWERP